MSDDQDQKTEPPSAKRLEEAREHGQLPVSREVAMWTSMLGVLMVFSMAVPSMMKQMFDYLHDFIASSYAIPVNEGSVQRLFLHVFAQTALICGVAFLLLMAAIVAGYMMQTGFFFSLDLIMPDFSRLSPMRGLKKLFSLTSLVELGKNLLKLIFLGGMAYIVLVPLMKESVTFSGFPIEGILAFVHKNVVHLIKMLVLVFTGIAILDFFYTRFQYIRGLRMSKADIKDEFKQQEGDPMIKGRLRQLRIEKARKRMMAQVPKADVVITNPTHYAVALKYEALKMSAPTVVAKGINMIAERIREIAEENNVPLVSNPPLARALYGSVEIDQQIPGEHYKAVAEIISYVYKLKKRTSP